MPTLHDCVYGQAVADALGVPYEFRPRGSFRCMDMVDHGSHNQPAGAWSDDTSMTLAICDSYRELGRIDADDIRERFVRWYREGAYTVDGLFDIGNATREALERGHGLAGGVGQRQRFAHAYGPARVHRRHRRRGARRLRDHARAPDLDGAMRRYGAYRAGPYRGRESGGRGG